MVKKISSTSIFLLIIAFGFLQKDELFLLVKQGGTLSVFISMLLVVICVFFPVIPYPILAGGIGAVFGAPMGTVISLSGAMAGTLVLFYLSRYGFRDVAQKKLEKYQKVKEYEEFLLRNSFLAILISRLIPIIPAPVITIICGLSQVHWLPFFVASAIGKLPNTLILAFAGATFSSNKLFSFGLYGIYLLFILLVNFLYVYRKSVKKSID
jgi:uncharacterized membrane protein YdjX (TVP38/TMEM64 family)